MPSRFERYRVKDGVTHLGERYFNPVFQDIDVRLAGLEELQLSWEAAVRAVSEFGLLRINEVIGPALSDVSGNVSEIEEKRDAAVAALAALESAIASIQDDASADIEAWKVDQLAELDAWQASLTASLPGIDARLDAVEGAVATKAESDDLAAAVAELDAKRSEVLAVNYFLAG